MKKQQWRGLLILVVVVGSWVSPAIVSAQYVREKLIGLLKNRFEQKGQDFAVEAKKYYLEHGGYKRSYYVYVPKKWDKKTPIPVVFLFHGGGGGAKGAISYYELEKKAESAGFLLVAPNGTGEFEDILLTWNVGFGFGYAHQKKVDDVGFVKTLLDHLEKTWPIDTRRVYATGLSNGAFLCHWLAAKLSDRFAAIAPVVGSLGGKEVHEKDWHTPPRPPNPVSVLIINGLIDDHVPIKGGLQKTSIAEPRLMYSASATIDFWVGANGCAPEAESFVDTARQASVFRHCGGRNGSEVIAYVLHNMGHAWPGSTKRPRAGSDEPSRVFPGNDVIWEFFLAHPLTSSAGGR